MACIFKIIIVQRESGISSKQIWISAQRACAEKRLTALIRNKLKTHIADRKQFIILL